MAAATTLRNIMSSSLTDLHEILYIKKLYMPRFIPKRGIMLDFQELKMVAAAFLETIEDGLLLP